VVPILARRHVIIVATCRDPDLEEAITAAPDEVSDVLRTTVSLDLLAARRRNFALLRSMGVVVVEAGPRALGSACVNAYARIKLAGRL
jgi:uncharacterized protein (DUF58 family)